MSLEIERKFLLKSLPNISPTKSIEIEQLYLKVDNIWERVRSCKSGDDITFLHTIKTNVSKGVNMEDEKNISEKEFLEFKDKCFQNNNSSKQIFKTRHIFPDKDLYWEVDEFHNDYKLIVAEIEIPSKNHEISIPKYISDIILLEVTGLKQFSNRSLSIKIEN